jgi:hypothetical protein
LLANSTHRLGPNFGAAVFEVVAVNGSDDGMLDTHDFDGIGDPAWLKHIHWIWFAGLNAAETARARTYISEDHEGGSTFSPTLAHVWTASAFADGVEFVLIDQASDFAVVFSGWELDAQPFWFLNTCCFFH